MTRWKLYRETWRAWKKIVREEIVREKKPNFETVDGIHNVKHQQKGA